MVEELKLAIKIDDATIEQSLLKQFANAQKMADKVVLDFKNVNFDDKQIEAKFKEMQKKAGQNPIDLTIGGNTLDMLGQIDKRLTEILSIGKGKSFIDSSSITKDISKVKDTISDINKAFNSTEVNGLKTQQEQIDKNIISLKKLLDLLYDIKNVDKSSYSGKYNTDWIGIYSNQEEAIKSNLEDRKNKLNSSLNIILSEDKNAIIELESEAERLKNSLQSIQDLSNRISSNSSISNLGKNTDGSFDYKSYADEYKLIDDRLGELNNEYELTNQQLEEYITLQVKAEKIMEKVMDYSGGVKGSGSKSKAELRTWIKKSFAQDLGIKPDEIYNGLFGNITDAIYSSWNGISLFDSTGAKRSLREISAEILNYKSVISGVTGSYGANEDAKKLRELNSVLNYIKTNANEIASTDFSSQIKEASELVNFYNKKVSEDNGDEQYSKSLENAKKNLQELLDLQNRLKTAKNESLSSQGTTISEQNKIQEELKETQNQAEKTSDILKETSITSTNDSQIEELKTDIVEVKTELGEVKDRISNIESNGFENVREDVEKTKESVKELNSELAEMKSNISSIPQESNISSGRKDAFQGNGIDNSKEQLAIDKQLTKELESQAKAQQKKWKSFQKENEIYQKKQSEVEAVKRNKDAYEELANAIKQYSEVSKRVSGGKAEDGDIEKMTQLEEKISQLQKQPILSDSQVAKSESALVSLYDQLDKIEKKLQETNQKQVDSGFSKLSTYQGKVDKYQATIDRFNDGGWTSSTYSENVKAVENAVKEYETLLNELKGKDASLVTSDEINKLDNYEKKIKDTIATVTNMSASEKGYNFVSGQKELDKIHKLLNENSKMSSEAKAKIKAYYAEIESGNPSMSLDKIHGEILKIYNAEVEAGRAGRTLWDTLKNSGFHQIAAQMAGMFGVYDVINVVRQGVNTVRELDTAMTEVRKVSNATESQYDSFKDTISSTAKEIATTNKELLNSSADFLRLGYSLDQASDLAKNATLFVNVGDGVDITEATEDMITAMKAFDIQAEDSIKIVDDYNQIGNRFALSASDIGEAMKRSASALETGNNSFEQSIGLITAMNEIVQNSENTGNSLKVLSLRLRGAKAELEDMQEDTDGLCDSTSKLREQIKSLTGVDIMLDDNTFKSTTDIIKELGTVWDKLSDSSQAATLELIAGKSRANNVAALLKNYQRIDEVMESLGDAEGSAMRENEAIVDSIDGRIKKLSASMEDFWQKAINTDFVKNIVSSLDIILNLLTKIIDQFGLLPTIIGVGGAGTGIFKFIKNFDWVLKPYTKNSLQQFLVGQS